MARKAAAKTKKVTKAKKEESSQQEESASIAEASSQAASASVNENNSAVADSADIEQAEEMINEVEVSSSKEEEQAEEVVGDASSSVSEETQSGSQAEELDDETLRTIFIKGLDYDATEDSIRTEMEKIGPVGRVNVPMTHDSRRNKGFAYVEFKKLIDTKKAMKLNGEELFGRKILVDQAKPKTNFLLYTVFVKNLSFDTTKAELLEYFNKFGKVHNVSLPVDNENEGRNRGFCFVEYTNEEIANKVVAGKHTINGRHLYLNLGKKNADRNAQRSNDRLYGRRDDRRDGGYGRRDDRRDGGYGRWDDRRDGGYGRRDDRRDGGYGRRDDRRDGYSSRKTRFDDDE